MILYDYFLELYIYIHNTYRSTCLKKNVSNAWGIFSRPFAACGLRPFYRTTIFGSKRRTYFCRAYMCIYVSISVYINIYVYIHAFIFINMYIWASIARYPPLPPTPWLWVCIVAPQYPSPPVVWVVVGGGGGGRSCICMYMNVYVWCECMFLVFVYDYDMICIWICMCICYYVVLRSTSTT